MIGIIGLVFNGLAAFKLWGTALGVVAIASTAACVWSWGVIDSRKNSGEDPGFSANVSMITTVAGFLLLFISFWTYTF